MTKEAGREATVVQEFHIVLRTDLFQEIEMKGKLVIDGNSVYELDEECIRKRRDQEKDQEKDGKNRETKRR